MNINKFLEKFLPDWKKKHQDFYEKNNHLLENNTIDVLFYDKYFSEALDNFINKICEEQRNICVDEMNKIYYNINQHDAVLYASNPNIDELC